MNENHLFGTLRRNFPADPDRPFLERPDGTSLSYRDLVDLSGRVARALTDLGVR